MTDPERRLSAILFLLGVKYGVQVKIGPYTADFVILTHNVVCEADGIYWHERPKAQLHDAKRDAYMTTLGYKVLRFTCEQLKSSPEGIISAIRGVLTLPVTPLLPMKLSPPRRMKSFKQIEREIGDL